MQQILMSNQFVEDRVGEIPVLSRRNGEMVWAGSSVFVKDDFLGQIVDPRWYGINGSSPDAVTAILPDQIGGVVSLSGPTTGAFSVAAEGLHSGVCFKPSLGGFVVEARISPITEIADVSIFFGVADTLAIGDVLCTWSTTPVNNGEAGEWGGFNIDVGAPTAPTAVANRTSLTDSTAHSAEFAAAFNLGSDAWQIWRIECGVDGVATFKIDGHVVAEDFYLCDPSIPLGMLVYVWSQSGGREIYLDHLAMAFNRPIP